MKINTPAAFTLLYLTHYINKPRGAEYVVSLNTY